MENFTASPEISVIVPVYNAEKFIERCLRSLLDQDFTKAYEIVVINDGSIDNTSEIIGRLAEENRNIIHVFSKKHGGISAARNAGLAHVRGKYVLFTDSDDFVERRYLSALYEAAERSGADITCCNYRNVNANNTIGIENIFRHRSGVFNSAEMLGALLRDITVRSYIWNKLFRRELFSANNIAFPVGVQFEDVRTMPRLFWHADKIAVIKDELYNYVQRKGSITGTMTPKKVFQYIGAYGGIREFLDEVNEFTRYACSFRFLGVKIAFTVLPMLVGCKRRDKSMKLGNSYKRAVKSLYCFASGGNGQKQRRIRAGRTFHTTNAR